MGYFLQQLPGAIGLAGGRSTASNPGPGILSLFSPDSEECAERSFFRLWLPQFLHFGRPPEPAMRIPLGFPQSIHRKSNSGMAVLPCSINRKNEAVYRLRRNAFIHSPLCGEYHHDCILGSFLACLCLLVPPTYYCICGT